MGELLPCPFCGNAPNPDPQNDDCPVPAGSRADGEFYLTIWCEACGAEGGKRLTRADAITAWNTRPRTEGRGEGEPVASEDQANHDCLAKRRPGEPMFIILGRDPDGHNIVRSWAERRLAAGGDPEHCEMGLATAERMRLYASDPANAPASAPPASAYASPIREPEISRGARLDAIEAAIVSHVRLEWHGHDHASLNYRSISEAADAILNLAPVAKGASQDAELSDEFDRPGRLSDATRHSAEGAADPALSGARGVVTPVEKGAGAEPGAGWVYNSPDTGMEYSPEHPLESGEIPDATDVRRSTFFEDWMFGEIGRLDAKVRELVVNLAHVGGRGEEGSSQSRPGVSAVQQPASSSAQHSDGTPMPADFVEEVRARLTMIADDEQLRRRTTHFLGEVRSMDHIVRVAARCFGRPTLAGDREGYGTERPVIDGEGSRDEPSSSNHI